MSARESEIWRSVAGYAGLYEVSNIGRVRRLFKNGNVKLRKPRLLHGYVSIQLANRGAKHVLVHRLVAAAFIPNPDGKKDVNHLNFDKADNRVENLEWATRSENMIHAVKAGRGTYGELGWNVRSRVAAKKLAV